ncbi:DMT family transporter [Bacillus altitudinis]|uniref:DMT family transporter n=1 Tax=Bacillus altitudinis TaxID=293387 RepID=UPI0024094A36|nr:multidrug efflux SMR transporter [Bacillus altitudinis]MDI6562174.1 multidrug efflux SMR transporter [Bacillus altitudinis]MED0852990.1 multidrug efflux SMR transporter [Bacillus altitudinis]
MILGYLFLAIAIFSEAIGAAMLKLSNGFTRFKPSAVVVAGYTLAFYMLSLTLNIIPLSMSYATWSGVGTALTALVGLVLFNETIHMKGFIGLALVICGVIVLNQSKKQKEEKKEPFDQTEWTS